MSAKAKGKGDSPGTGTLATNRRAGFQYQLLERFECGIELVGTEAKSLREGGASFADAYVHVLGGEAWLEGFHIRPFSHAGPLANHEPVRTRKLLLKRSEIEKLVGGTQQKGYTIVPVRVYTKGRWIKLELALARGKKLHDKREDQKERIVKREIDRALKAQRERGRR
jgi:SsrA-binding protein